MCFDYSEERREALLAFIFEVSILVEVGVPKRATLFTNQLYDRLIIDWQIVRTARHYYLARYRHNGPLYSEIGRGDRLWPPTHYDSPGIALHSGETG